MLFFQEDVDLCFPMVALMECSWELDGIIYVLHHVPPQHTVPLLLESVVAISRTKGQPFVIAREDKHLPRSACCLFVDKHGQNAGRVM